MRQLSGQRGEAIAEVYLKRKGYRILGRNIVVWGGGGKQIGELDIIARKGGDVVFVEVKAGSVKGPAWRPELHMTPWKRGRLRRAAMSWLASKNLLEAPWQIDTIAVEFSPHARPKLRHLRQTSEE